MVCVCIVCIGQCSTCCTVGLIFIPPVQETVKMEDLKLLGAMYNVVFQVYADKVCVCVCVLCIYSRKKK